MCAASRRALTWPVVSLNIPSLARMRQDSATLRARDKSVFNEFSFHRRFCRGDCRPRTGGFQTRPYSEPSCAACAYEFSRFAAKILRPSLRGATAGRPYIFVSFAFFVVNFFSLLVAAVLRAFGETLIFATGKKSRAAA